MKFFQDFRISDPQELFGVHRPRSLVNAGAWTMVSNVSAGFWQIVTGVVLARLIAPDAFGTLALVTIFYNLLTGFLGIAFAAASVQKAELTEQQASNFFWVNVAVSGMMAVALGISGPILASFYDLPELSLIALAYSFLILINALGIQHRALINRAMRYDISSRIALVLGPMGLLIAVPLALMGFGLWALVIQAVVGGVLERIFLWWALPWVPKPYRKGAGIRSMIQFGSRSAFALLVNFCYESMQSLIMGKMASPAQVGFYNRGQSLFQRPIGQVTHPLLAVLLPRMSSLQDRPREMEAFVIRTLWALSILVMPLLVWMSLFGEQFAISLLGDQWSTAGRVMKWFALGAIIGVVMMPLSKACEGLGTPSKGLAARVVFLPFFIFAILRVVEQGAEPVAIVYVGANTAVAPFALFLVFRNSPLAARPILFAMLGSVGCAIISIILVVALDMGVDGWLLDPALGAVGSYKLVAGAAAALVSFSLTTLLFVEGRRSWAYLFDLLTQLWFGFLQRTSLSKG